MDIAKLLKLNHSIPQQIDLPKLDCPFSQQIVFYKDVNLIASYGLCCSNNFQTVFKEFDADNDFYKPTHVKKQEADAYAVLEDIRNNGPGSRAVKILSNNYWHVPIVHNLSLVWGHWTDTLQKLYRLEIEYGGRHDDKQFAYIFNRREWKHPGVKHLKEWLSFFGISLERCYFRDDEPDLADTVLHIPFAVAASPVTYTAHASSAIMKKFRHDVLFPLCTPNPKRKIFLLRGATCKSRIVLNKNEVLVYLKSHGFEIINADVNDFQATQSLFSGVSHILSLHHSGIKNCIFSADGTKILEIYPSKFKNKIDKSIMVCCENMSADYTQVVMDSDSSSNVKIDLIALDKLLKDEGFI